MNIYDVAKKSGVSIATVSRVLNGSSRVSDKTREKVTNAMKELGYVPNVFARSLGLNTMHMVGIMCADASDTYLAAAVHHLEKDLRAQGYDSLLCCTGYALADKEKAMKILLQKRVDAVFLVGSSHVEDNDKENTYIRQAAQTLPILLLNGVVEGQNIYSFLCDDEASSFQVTNTLLAQDIQHPLCLYRRLSYSSKQKIKGFRRAFEAHGIKNPDAHLLTCRTDMDKTKDILLNFAKIQTFDGILASEDILAVGAVKYAKAAGLKIPEDISIVGFNNSILARCCEPEITSVDNKIEDLCALATAALMQILSGESIPQTTVIPGELIHRQTTLIR